jgi:hypothetical protein
MSIQQDDWGDKLERMAATFVQGFLAVFIIDGGSIADSGHAAAIAGAAAVLALVKAWSKDVLDSRGA